MRRSGCDADRDRNAFEELKQRFGAELRTRSRQPHPAQGADENVPSARIGKILPAHGRLPLLAGKMERQAAGNAIGLLNEG